ASGMRASATARPARRSLLMLENHSLRKRSRSRGGRREGKRTKGSITKGWTPGVRWALGLPRTGQRSARMEEGSCGLLLRRPALEKEAGAAPEDGDTSHPHARELELRGG